ncbi:MAG: hypothetical protein OXI96_03000 [Acidimicrobiaceae bacterium]|nr:hypothetical protein [Acidimicrobiaceae bacterium]
MIAAKHAEEHAAKQPTFTDGRGFALDLGAAAEAPEDADRDNITDWCLNKFRSHYGDSSITKDDIWEYMYGVMHAPDWRERYRYDLQRNRPHIPFAPDFETFRRVGRELMDLHIGYETCAELDLECRLDGEKVTDDTATATAVQDLSAFRIRKAMRWGRGSSGRRDDRTVLEVNERCWLVGIPQEAHEYRISGRSPLEWAVTSIQVKQNKSSGIVEDPNGWHVWAGESYNLIRHLRRLAFIGVKSAELIAGLPPSLPPEEPTKSDLRKTRYSMRVRSPQTTRESNQSRIHAE